MKEKLCHNKFKVGDLFMQEKKKIDFLRTVFPNEFMVLVSSLKSSSSLSACANDGSNLVWSHFNWL